MNHIQRQLEQALFRVSVVGMRIEWGSTLRGQWVSLRGLLSLPPAFHPLTLVYYTFMWVILILSFSGGPESQIHFHESSKNPWCMTEVPICSFVSSATSLRMFFLLHFITGTSTLDRFVSLLPLPVYSDLTIRKLKVSFLPLHSSLVPIVFDRSYFVCLEHISDNILISQINLSRNWL